MKIKQWRGVISGATIGLGLGIIGFTINEWQFWFTLIVVLILIEGSVIVEKLDN
jgi:uncharacterized membrane protein YgaE (UPF0421/DUF939 family)